MGEAMNVMERLPTNAPHIAVPTRERPPRYHELDWLRAFIILALVPSHAIGFFTANTAHYYGTGYSSSVGLSSLMTVGSWGIALLFFVAGAAAYSMLSRRSPRQFIGERCVRLLIPMVFASLTLIPLQVYLIIRTFPSVLGQVPAPAGWDPHFADSPATFYLWFVGGYLSFLTHYSPQYEFIFWSHLWFVPRLLAISLLTLPLLLFLQRVHGAKFVSWLAVRCERHRGAVFVFAVPLGLVLAVLGWQWQGWQVVGAPDSSNMLAQLVFYAVVYMYGFIIYADMRMRQAVRRDGGVVALAVGVLTFIITQLPGVGNQALAHDYSAGGILAAVLRAVAAWLCIIGVVGLGMRSLAFTNQFGKYLTEASYPFYVLHLAVLYLVGLPLIAGGANPVLAFLVMVSLTYAITLAVYDVLIRRIPPARLLFGLKKKQASVFG